ncbi:hypothetical protein ACVL5V_004945 [Bradyrhizobium ottawaense]
MPPWFSSTSSWRWMVPTVALVDVAEPLRGLADGCERILLRVRPLLPAIGHDGIEQRAQILHVDQGQPGVVGDAEGNVEHAFLHVVEVEHACEQKRPHFRDGRAHRMALLAEHVPEHRRELIGLEIQPHSGGALDDEVFGFADLGDAGEVALDVGGEDRNTGARKSFRHHLQRHSLTGSGCTCDEAVAIGERQRQPGLLLSLADEDLVVGIAELAVLCGHYSL